MSVQVDERAAAAGPQLRPESCAAMSAALGEPVAGTAPVAQAWLAVEVPGPWSKKVLQDMARPWLVELDQRAKASGVSLIAVRRPGRADPSITPGGHVLLACTVPGRTAAAELTLPGPEALADLDLSGLASGVMPLGARAVHTNTLLVCTNSKRDVCCAVAGRALAETLDRARPGRVWQSSHLGGHRFAPTALVLPSGYAYARVTPETALGLIDADPTAAPDPTGCRGRSAWDRQGQLAEIEARRLLAENGLTFDADEITVETTAPDVRTVVTTSGLRVPVRIGESEAQPARSISCGADPVTPPVLSALAVGPISQ
jgi:hypothetical protein